MSDTPNDDDLELPPALEKIQEALYDAQAAIEELQDVLESIGEKVASEIDIDEVLGLIEEYLEQIDSADPLTIEMNEEAGNPCQFQKRDPYDLLNDFKRIEAEDLAEALRNLQGPDSLDGLDEPPTPEQMTLLESAFAEASKAAWYVYELMIEAV